MHKPGPTLFGTPLDLRGWKSLPFTQLALWLFMAWWAGRRRPERSLAQRLGVGLLTMPALLSWEWMHNIAHAIAARRAGRPMDALKIMFGMPVCVYSVENHRGATPRQHITRALGGPVINTAALPFIAALRALAPAGSLRREVLDAAFHMDLFLATASWLPMPGIDGGPLLKWSLVQAGAPPEQANATLRKVDLALSPALAALAWAHFRRGRWISGALALFFAVIALTVGLNLYSGETAAT
jgi:hypothetical protein